MSKLFSFRYNSKFLNTFPSNALAIPKHNVCTHESKHYILVMRDGLHVALFKGFRLFGNSLDSRARGLSDLRMADSLMNLMDELDLKGVALLAKERF